MAEECLSARPETYNKVIQECEQVIELDFKPCGLEDDIKKRLCDLIVIWKYKKMASNEKGVVIGGTRVIFSGLLRVVELARHLSKRYDKDMCYYLERACSGNRDRDLGFTNYCVSMWCIR